MSKKLEEKINANKETYKLSESEFVVLQSLFAIQQTYNHYQDQVKTQYLMSLAVERLGYSMEDDIQFNIDMNSQDRMLSVEKVN